MEKPARLVIASTMARTFSSSDGALRVTSRASWRISSSISKEMTISSRICVETRASSSDRISSGV